MLAIPAAWDAEAERLLHPISLTPAWPTQKDLFLSKYRKQNKTPTWVWHKNRHRPKKGKTEPRNKSLLFIQINIKGAKNMQ